MEKGYGSDVAHGASWINPRASLVRLGSGSQIFTWIAALKAIEEGKLKLNAPVNGYLPEDLQIPDEGFNQPILFRHLMSHTAGFEDRALGRRYVLAPDELTSLDDALRRLRPRRVRAAGLLSIPSDYGVALAGDVIAKAEARPFDQLIESEILKPLAMTHTSFREPYSAASGLPDPLSPPLAGAMATGFRWTAQGFQPQPFAYGQSLAPALSASTTADDMARLMIALLGNGRMGEVALYGPSSAVLLRSPLQRPAPSIDGWVHGLVMQPLAGGFEALSEPGVAPTFRTNLSLVPGLNLGIFVVADTDTGGGLAQDLPGSIVQRFYVSKPANAPHNAAMTADDAGDYLSARRAYHGLEAFADRLTLQSRLEATPEGGLALHAAGKARLFAPTMTPDQFQSEEGAELFAPTVDGRAKAYVLGSGGGSAERVGGVHERGVLVFWAAAALFTVLASFAGLFTRDRLEARETRVADHRQCHAVSHVRGLVRGICRLLYLRQERPFDRRSDVRLAEPVAHPGFLDGADRRFAVAPDGDAASRRLAGRAAHPWLVHRAQAAPYRRGGRVPGFHRRAGGLGRAGALVELNCFIVGARPHRHGDPLPLPRLSFYQKPPHLGVVVESVSLDGVEDRLGEIVEVHPGRIAGVFH